MYQELSTRVAYEFDRCHTIVRQVSKVPESILQQPRRVGAGRRSGTCSVGSELHQLLPLGRQAVQRNVLKQRVEAASLHAP